MWKRGAWSALGLALGFAALVNITVVASLVWTELFPDAVRKAAWLAAAAVWVGSATVARWRDRAAARQDDPPQTGDPYCQAVEHYLKGDWFEAECLLAGLLRSDSFPLGYNPDHGSFQMQPEPQTERGVPVEHGPVSELVRDRHRCH